MKYEQDELLKLIPEHEDPPVEDGRKKRKRTQQRLQAMENNDDTNADFDEEEDDEEDLAANFKYVFPSAAILFDGMRKTMMKCASFHIQQTMFEIFNVFRGIMQKYAAALKERVTIMITDNSKQKGAYDPKNFATAAPSATAASASGTGAASSSSGAPAAGGKGNNKQILTSAKPIINFTEEDIRIACTVIGTCEYVDYTLPLLCESFMGYIGEQFHHQMDFDSEQELFGSLTTRIYQDVLVASCQKAMTPALQTISRTPWASYSESGNRMQSAFVAEIGNAMLAQFRTIGGLLSKLHYLKI